MSGPKMEKPKQDVFQAVVLADNFGQHIFGNSSSCKAEALLHLANRRIIDYALEALTSSGVHEIIIYSTRDIEELKQYIASSGWYELPTTITIVASDDTHTLGEALRDLDAKALLRNDFILMQAGVVTNVRLKPLLEKHRATAASDKGAVMTLIHRKMLPGHPSRGSSGDCLVAVDSKTNKILAYQTKVSGKKLIIPLENMQPEIELFLDCCDTGISVCSSSVPPLFTDNFDFATMNDFVRGILINEEIMGNSLYLDRLERGYASRVVDFKSFKGISLDIIQRWSYPLVPDMPFGSPNDSVCPFNYNYSYKGIKVKVDKRAELGPLVLIEQESEVGESSVIARSCLGKKCKVGSNVKIINSFVGNNVEIPDGCQLHEVFIVDGSILEPGTELKPWVLVDGKSQHRIELPVEREIAADSSSDEDSDVVPIEEGDPEIDDEDANRNVGIQDEDFKIFSTEVLESLLGGYKENVAVENLVLEINSSKYAYNITFKEVIVAITKGLLQLVLRIHPDLNELPLKSKWEKTKEFFAKFKSLFEHYVKTEENQADLLIALEEYANDRSYFRPMLMQTIHLLYDQDILFEDAIVEWHKMDSLYEAGKELRELTQQFINWLEDAEEDDDDDADSS